MISPEALENGRASDGSRENIVMGDIDDDTAVITTGGMMGSIAAALQAERDAAAPSFARASDGRHGRPMGRLRPDRPRRAD